MSDENKAVTRRFMDEIIAKKNLAVFDELVSPNVVAHHVPPGVAPNFQGWKGIVTMVLGAFPDVQATTDDMIAEGDMVVVRWTMQGTHKGDLMGIPPTGKAVSFTGMIMEHYSGGKIVEHWEQFDMVGMMQQIGVVPTPGQ